MLTGAPNQGKVAHRDALVKEVCWLTGTTPDNRIPTSLRRNPNTFFAMWEKMRSKAQKMIADATKPVEVAAKPSESMLLLSAADAADANAAKAAKAEGIPDPGLSAAGKSEASSSSMPDKRMLASLLVDGEVVKTKRISVPLSLSSLKMMALCTFDLPQDSDLAFEVLEANTKDVLVKSLL